MIYFISGHRNLSYKDFELYYKPVIDNVVINDKEAEFVVGDYDGVDKFAMDYIYEEYCVPLTIYYMFDTPRNTPRVLSGDPNSVGVYFRGGFTSDEERDSAMTKISDFDIAFVKNNRWDSGTAQNIERRHNLC
jgi:hypothetical protein